MKMQIFALFAASLLAAGCACDKAVDLDFYKEDAPVGGAAAVQGQSDVKKSPYFKNINFFEQKPSKTLVILPKFKTMQQTSDFTTQSAVVKMVLDYLGCGKDATERSLAKEMGVRDDAHPRCDGGFGTTVEAMVKALEVRGVKTESGEVFENETAFAEFVNAQLKAGNPILVCYSVWGAHWVVVIGYDNMGTDTPDDDVLVIADPYDIGDHHQNGYGVEPLSRFFWSWYDPCVMYGEPAIEPYIVAKRPAK